MDLKMLIEAAHRFKASDIHLMEGIPPYFRVDGVILPTKEPAVTHEDMQQALESVLPKRLQGTLNELRSADFSYQHKDLTRCRLNGFYENRKLSLVIRLIPLHVPTIEELEIAPELKDFSDYYFGLVLLTGPTGSGKTNTLAAILKHINSTQKKSIVTIEDPIEFVHQPLKSIIRQREIGEDVLNFNQGIINAMRQDPDVILVGEMRDMETIGSAIKASETGHLVFSTLHTTTAVMTIERIISVFPELQHAILREQLAVNLRAVVTQALVRRAAGKGRIAAQEILICNAVISKLILENRMDAISAVMRGGEGGMQVFDQALAKFVRAKLITLEEGKLNCKDEFAFMRYVKGVNVSSDAGGVLAGF